MNNFSAAKNVAVFFGGCSSEYSVSLQSAYAVIRNLDRERFRPVPIGITRDGKWFYFSGDIERIPRDTWHDGADCVPAVLSPDRGAHCLLLLKNGCMEQIRIDVAFPVLHGRNGEDGTLQGLIELAGIPLAGCGVLSSALCMDKHRAHQLAGLAGVRIPGAQVFPAGGDMEALAAFARKTGFPLFVKPVHAGSSYGVSRVLREDDLSSAVRLASEYDDEVIIEEGISGFEVGCAVLGNDDLTVGAVDEIALSGGFFDFTEKYTLKTSAIYVPARIDDAKADEIKETARVIYRALGCQGFARVDMFLTQDGEIVFNEVNTIPGFTEHSRYPGMMRAAGYTFPEILTRIIELACM